DDRDVGVGAERVLDVVELLPHDGAAVAQLGQGFGEGSPEPAPHAGSENHDLGGHCISFGGPDVTGARCRAFPPRSSGSSHMDTPLCRITGYRTPPSSASQGTGS